MADTGIFATTAEILRKAGANASAVSTAEAYTNDFIAQAESFINSICCFNFSDVYASLNADVKAILKEAASNLAAMYVINYNLNGFYSQREAETMLDVLDYRATKAINELKSRDVQSFIRAA